MSSDEPILRVTGAVDSLQQYSYRQFCDFAAEFQVPDVSQAVPSRPGAAIQLEGLLSQVHPHADVDYIGLHSSRDDFHASIPLESVRATALLIYGLDGRPLSPGNGGPIRFLIPDHAACHTAEVDECANVKFVDHIEFTCGKGHDNRPEDDQEHARLHEGP